MILHLRHLPDRDLNPNKRLHHMELYKAKHAAKMETYLRVYSDGHGRPPTPYSLAHITITWVAKDRRRRDIDNLFASMKAYIDGLVYSQVILDDSADRISYTLIYEHGDEDDTIIQIDPVEYLV